MTLKLEKGQVYKTIGGHTITVGGSPCVAKWIRENDDKKEQSTFRAWCGGPGQSGEYYGDGPLVGKYQWTGRSVGNPGSRSEDLIMPVLIYESEQLSLFD